MGCQVRICSNCGASISVTCAALRPVGMAQEVERQPSRFPLATWMQTFSEFTYMGDQFWAGF